MSNDPVANSGAGDTPQVEMYSSEWCGFCRAARRLLSRKGVEVALHSVDGNPEIRAEMEARSGRHTVPQIFIGDRHVGGCDDLQELDFDGELDTLLAGGDV